MSRHVTELENSSSGGPEARPEDAGIVSKKVRRKVIITVFSVATGFLLILFGKSALQKAWDVRRTEEGYRVLFTIPKTRKPAPEFALPTLDGKRLRLSDLRGQVVLLSFRTTW